VEVQRSRELLAIFQVAALLAANNPVVVTTG
jgi:hypothetical protein